MISAGVALTSHGELNFNLTGFIFQGSAVLVRFPSRMRIHTYIITNESNVKKKTQFEASRLLLIQILLHNLKMDPLVSLHYYAPVCAVLNLLILPFTEGLAPFYELPRIGALVLLSNAAVAFLLNVAAVFLVGVGSGLVLTLAGVFKDILLIAGSVVFFGSEITSIQVFGYSIALGGLVLFKTSGSK